MSTEGKDLRIAVLLDFYGGMLTEKQRDVIDLYYNEDLSLGEIAQIEKITRQGVRDSIKRGEEFLCELEEKLGMLRQYRQLQKTFEEISRLSTEIYKISDTYKYSAKLSEAAMKIMKIAEQNIDR